MKIFICTNDAELRSTLESIANDYASMEQFSISLGLSTGSPLELLDYVKDISPEKSLYILDVDTKDEVDGILMAAKIREQNQRSKIVLLSIYPHLSQLAIMHGIEALDYIDRNRSECMQYLVKKSIETAHSRLNAAS